MHQTQQPTVFVAPSGKMFVYLTDFPRDGDVLYSPDGVTFYALVSRGFGGSTLDHDLSFEDPHHDVSSKLHRTDDVIKYDGEQYVQQDVPFDPSSAVPLPYARRVEYLCQAEDGTVIYVGSDKYNYSYESFRLYVGDGASMREVHVEDVARYRDGGTTYVRTSEETFFSPSPFNSQRDPELVPTWGDTKLVDLNKDDYDITETPNGEVSIIKKG